MSENPPRQVDIKNLSRMTLWANTPGVEGRRSRLAWSTIDWNPRITIFTNDPGDTENKGMIACGMDYRVFEGFVDEFRKVINRPESSKQVINNLNKERRIRNKLWFGKDEDGIVWICVEEEARPKIVFRFEMHDWHEFIDSTGKPMTPAFGSVRTANAYLNVLHAAMTDILVQDVQTMSESRKPKGNGNGGGGGYSRNNNGGRNNGGGSYDRNERREEPRQPTKPASSSSDGFDDLTF